MAHSSTPIRFPEKKQRVPLRARRRRARLIGVVVALVLLGVAVWSIGYISYLPSLTVGAVSVAGAEGVSPHLVQAYAESQIRSEANTFLSRENIFLFDEKKIAKSIVEHFPRIKSAEITRESMFATAVAVSVVERTAFARWCAQSPQGDETGDCYLLDTEGFVFERLAAESTSTIPIAETSYVFHGGFNGDPMGRQFAPAHFPGIASLLRVLSQANFAPRGATIDNDQDFSIPLSSGFYIKASFGEDVNRLVHNLQLVLSSSVLQGKEDRIEYIDLRFGGRVYYKLKGQEETTVSP